MQMSLVGFETLSNRLEKLRKYVETIANVVADLERNAVWRDEE